MKGKKQKNNKKNKKKEESDEDEKSSSNEENGDVSPQNSEDDDEDIDVKYLKGKYFIFAKTNKKKMVTIPKSSKEPGIQLEIGDFTKGGSRKFEIEPVDGGMYTIKSCLSNLYLKIKEGFKTDEVIQDEFNDSNEFKWIFEPKDDEKKCVYIKSAVGGEDSQDFYMLIDGYVPKPHAKIIIGPYEPSQSFMLLRNG